MRGVSLADLDRELNTESGLEGLSDGRDLRELVAEADDEEAQLALQVYTYRIAAAVSAMGVALDGVDTIVFTAGVGEHSAAVRAAICARLGFLSVELDSDLNEGATPDADIAAAAAAVRVLVIAAREELVVARAVHALLDPST